MILRAFERAAKTGDLRFVTTVHNFDRITEGAIDSMGKRVDKVAPLRSHYVPFHRTNNQHRRIFRRSMSWTGRYRQVHRHSRLGIRIKRAGFGSSETFRIKNGIRPKRPERCTFARPTNYAGS